MASTKFAYLKSQKGEAPFYVHLTLDEKEQSLRVYYHWSFWKKEEVDLTVFQTWMDHFKNVEPLLTKRKKKNTLVVKRNSVKVRGRCIILSQMFKDIIGFTEKNTEHELPAKIECYANAENRMIEVDVRHLEMPAPMMTILDELEKLEHDKALYVHHKRIPIFLLSELKDRNFEYRINEISANEVFLLIFKK